MIILCLIVNHDLVRVGGVTEQKTGLMIDPLIDEWRRSGRRDVHFHHQPR
jgi:hypothetical protein